MTRKPRSLAPVSATPGRPAIKAPWKARLLTIFVALVVTASLCAAGLWWTRGQELLHARWTYPWALVLLLFVPLLFWRGTWGQDRRVARLRLGTVAAFLHGPTGARVWLRDLPGVLRALSFTLLVLALARPVDTLRPESTDEQGIDLMVLLDLSGSMQAVMENLPPDLAPLVTTAGPDIPPARVDAAKAVIRDFISRRKTDRIGVIVFGRNAYVLSPPTLDYQLLDLLVSKMNLKVIDGNGTAIGDAIGAAVARLRKSSAKSKGIILLTDGDNNSGKISPQYAVELAIKHGVKVFTIQIGDGRKARVYNGRSLLGQPTFVTTEFPVNPKLLKSLAAQSGGAAYVATDGQALRASFHDVLDKLEKSRLEASVARFEELFPVLIVPGVILLFLEALLRAFVLRRFP